ncbi:hypothetical protein SS50377_20713 [Spironucleus salmonicida]|uniref:Uncharacterized protein n=1 Tax=Spironucleus salmonicida TaxID=348837 RepID=A0A9P8LZV9_9EUKA|nr:hypothetical protein SS50377_20713 [Spironucleus salmonicida]
MNKCCQKNRTQILPMELSALSYTLFDEIRMTCVQQKYLVSSQGKDNLTDVYEGEIANIQ